MCLSVSRHCCFENVSARQTETHMHTEYSVSSSRCGPPHRICQPWRSWLSHVPRATSVAPTAAPGIGPSSVSTVPGARSDAARGALSRPWPGVRGASRGASRSCCVL